MKRRIIAILPLLAAVAATRIVGSIILPVYDDAFITFRYGKNLVEIGNFVYNAGEWVLGTTTPAFGLLSALFYAVHLPMLATVLVLNICIDIAIAYIIYRFVSEAFNYTAAVFSVLFFAVSPILIRISVGGMEADLFVLLVLTSLLLYRRKRIAVAVVIASLSYFVRPEGALLALFLIGNEAARRHFGSAIKLAVASFLTVVPGLVIIYLSYGSFISQSVAAKVSEHQSIIEVFKRLVIPEAASIAFLAISLVGIKEILRAKGVSRSFFGFVALYFAAYLIMRPWIWSWYAMPVQTALVVGAGIAAASFVKKFAFVSRPMWERYAAFAGMCCVCGVWVGLLLLKGSSGITDHIYGSLATSTSHLQGSRILATDIGAVGYFSQARIYDGLGLVTPDARKHASLDDMIRADEPDALFLNTTKETRALMSTDYFSHTYQFERRYSPTGSATLPADSSAYVDGWQQDYLLFVRR